MFHVDICNDRVTDEAMTAPCNCNFIEFLIEAEDAVGDSEFQKLDEFFCRDLVDIGEPGAGRNFGIDHLYCNRYWYASEESTDLNETKVSSSGFIERCLIFWKKFVLPLTKDEVLPQ